MLEQLKELLVTKFQVPADEVVAEAILADLDLDSLDIVELAMAIQSELGVNISEDELGDLAESATLDAIGRLIESRGARL